MNKLATKTAHAKTVNGKPILATKTPSLSPLNIKIFQQNKLKENVSILVPGWLAWENIWTSPLHRKKILHFDFAKSNVPGINQRKKPFFAQLAEVEYRSPLIQILAHLSLKDVDCWKMSTSCIKRLKLFLRHANTVIKSKSRKQNLLEARKRASGESFAHTPYC